MSGSGTGRIELMLLVDGELQGRDAALVGRQCRDDPLVGATVSALEAERALLRAAFPLTRHSDGPVVATVEAAFRARRRRRRRAGLQRVAAMLAIAALPAVAIGVGVLTLAERRAQDAATYVLAEQARDRQLMSAAFNTALDTQISGGSVTWQNPASGSRGTITPLRTFRTTDGRWCREYRQQVDSAAQSEQRIGIACREADGWQLKLERPWAA